MKMTMLATAVASLLGGFAGVASAEVYGDTARVISSTPIYDRVSAPRRDCRVEQVTVYEERRVASPQPAPGNGVAGTVLGAVVGGVLGHQVGSGRGNDAATVGGAVVGGLIGNNVERNANARDAGGDVTIERVPVTRDVERCNTVADSREVIVGYDVRYEYNGHEFRTRTAYDPGPQLPVNVDVRPPEAPGPATGPRTPSYRGTY